MEISSNCNSSVPQAQNRRRKNNRLKCWDYSNNGQYFITFVVAGRKPILGKIEENFEPPVVVLSPLGGLCQKAGEDTAENSNGIKIVQETIMPDHIHVIIELHDASFSISEFIRRWKAKATVLGRQIGFQGVLWQKGFYDRVIRDEEERMEIAEYIATNPARWVLGKNE